MAEENQDFPMPLNSDTQILSMLGETPATVDSGTRSEESEETTAKETIPAATTGQNSEQFANSSEESPVDLLLGLIRNADTKQLFSHYKTEDLLKLSLAEILAEVSAKSISGPWQQTTDGDSTVLEATFTFDKFSAACCFQSDVCRECWQSEHHPHAINLTMSDKTWSVYVKLGTTSNNALSEKDIKVAQYANYLYTSYSTREQSRSGYYYDDYYFAEQTKNLTKLRDSLKGQSIYLTAEQQIQAFEDAGRKMLKVPVARIGEWKHPVYGDLAFTQQDFDDIIRNFSDGILGYEPPLFLGHPNNTDSTEGHPAEGFLTQFVQEAEVLYGLFEVVNEETYTSVQDGKYRYSSGEFIREYLSKEEGAESGTVMVGMALTNRPFLTGLPRVRALSDQVADTTTNQNHQPIEIVMTTTSTAAAAAPTNTLEVAVPASAPSVISIQEFSDFKATVTKELDDIKQAYTQALSEQKGDYEQKLSEATTKLSEAELKIVALTERADKAETRLREEALAIKLSELDKLVIPKELKEQYSELIKNGSLGSQEGTVMGTLRAMSEQNKLVALKQHGTAPSTQAFNDAAFPDPYKDVVERNQKAVEDRTRHLSDLLNRYSP